MNAGSVELFKNKKKAARHKPNSLLVWLQSSQGIAPESNLLFLHNCSENLVSSRRILRLFSSGQKKCLSNGSYPQQDVHLKVTT